MNDSGIPSRAVFEQVLDQTLAEVEELAEAHPDFPPWEQVRRQLVAMKQWSAKGRDPTAEERKRVSIGVIAMREIEPVAGVDLWDLCQRLHQLQYYFQVFL